MVQAHFTLLYSSTRCSKGRSLSIALNTQTIFSCIQYRSNRGARLASLLAHTSQQAPEQGAPPRPLPSRRKHRVPLVIARDPTCHKVKHTKCLLNEWLLPSASLSWAVVYHLTGSGVIQKNAGLLIYRASEFISNLTRKSTEDACWASPGGLLLGLQVGPRPSTLDNLLCRGLCCQVEKRAARLAGQVHQDLCPKNTLLALPVPSTSPCLHLVCLQVPSLALLH